MGIPVRRGIEWGRRCPRVAGGMLQLFGLATRFVACAILDLVEIALVVRRQTG